MANLNDEVRNNLNELVEKREKVQSEIKMLAKRGNYSDFYCISEKSIQWSDLTARIEALEGLNI